MPSYCNKHNIQHGKKNDRDTQFHPEWHVKGMRIYCQNGVFECHCDGATISSGDNNNVHTHTRTDVQKTLLTPYNFVFFLKTQIFDLKKNSDGIEISLHELQCLFLGREYRFSYRFL